MNTNPTVSRFVDRANATTPPNTLAKADEEGDAYKYTCISRGHHACDSGNTTHIIIEKGGKIGCSCGGMTYRCTGTDVCKHIARFIELNVPPQIPASSELIKKLQIMGWVGGKDDLHPAELLKPTPDEIAVVVAKTAPETKMVHYECPKCGDAVDIEADKLQDWKLTHIDICPGKKVVESPDTDVLAEKVEAVAPLIPGIYQSENPVPPEETKMEEEPKKTYTHPDGSEFETAETLLDYAERIKKYRYMDETKALITPSDATAITAQAWSDEQIEVMKNTVAEKATPAEFAYFMEVARCSGLNPFLREIYFMKTDKGQTAIITGRDGYLTIAKRDKRFMGIQSMDVCEKDEFEMGYSNGIMEVTKHSIKDFQDRGGVIGAWARGQMDGETPVTAFASIKEYDKGGNIWTRYKSAMIKKVAESMVLKRIAGISGLVTEAEIPDQPNMMIDAEEIR